MIRIRSGAHGSQTARIKEVDCMRLIHGDYEKCIEYCREMAGEEFFEFDFPFVSSDEKFRELDRFLWESRHQHTRFQNRYEGRVVIDITAWNKRYPNEYFEAFLYFLKGNEDIYSCVMISAEPYSHEVLEKLGKLFKIKEVQLDGASRSKNKKPKMGFAPSKEEEMNQNV